MNTLVMATAVRKPSVGQRLRDWIVRASRRLGWRQVALAALISILAATFGPNGGAFLYPGQRVSDPFAEMLGARWLFSILPLVFAVMIADEAYEDGVPVVMAYGIALVLGATVAGYIDAGVGLLTWWNRGGVWSPQPFRFTHVLLQGSLVVAIYAYWRTTQRALRRVQASEAERVIGRQQLLAARLLALQARVEPDFLFDSLSRIEALHHGDPETADALLADLIALLRAMLPMGNAATSTVAREFELAAAWLRVQRHMGSTLDIEIATSPIVAASGLGAMLVLPLLQEMQALAGASTLSWRLSAESARSDGEPGSVSAATGTRRLCLRLVPHPALSGSAGEAFVTPGVERLRVRITELHGTAATLSAVMLRDHVPAFVLELPSVPETAIDDHRADR